MGNSNSIDFDVVKIEHSETNPLPRLFQQQGGTHDYEAQSNQAVHDVTVFLFPILL